VRGLGGINAQAGRSTAAEDVSMHADTRISHSWSTGIHFFFFGESSARMDPYQELGVSTCASLDEIKAAFRERARQCHPDKVCTAAACFRSAAQIKILRVFCNRRRYCILGRTHARTHERTHAPMQASTHARTHAYTHDCKHAHTHAYIHHGRSLAPTHPPISAPTLMRSRPHT
jgi:hypothetical protein